MDSRIKRDTFYYYCFVTCIEIIILHCKTVPLDALISTDWLQIGVCIIARTISCRIVISWNSSTTIQDLFVHKSTEEIILQTVLTDVINRYVGCTLQNV